METFCSPYAMRGECYIIVAGPKRGRGLLDWGRAPTFFVVGFPIVLYLFSDTIFAIRAMQVPL